MIGAITGKIINKTANTILIDCNGVGYEVMVPAQTRFNLDGVSSTTLSTHLVIKEDSHSLFGFSTQRDRDLFRLLITVNGIGAKIAIAMMSFYSTGELAEAIVSRDVPALTKIPGIGKKGAEKIAVDLSKKIHPFVYVDPEEQARRDQSEAAQKDATDALVALGFKEKDVEKAIESVFEDGMSSAQLTRAALKAIKG